MKIPNEKKASRDETVSDLRRLGPWNFLVELEPELFTIPRLHWQGLWHNIVVQDYISRTLPSFLNQVLGTNRKDISIVDIGCNEGWLTTLLWRLGYSRIVGVDGNRKNIEKAKFIKNYLGMGNVEFILSDLHDFKTEESFDVSIMLGVVNHLHNPVDCLKNIHSFTNQYIVLDFNAFCSDYHDTERVHKPDETNLTAIFGNMKSQFEDAGDLTSITDGNLVFQFSRRAIIMLMNFTGFGDVLELHPGIAIPPNYKNNKRVYLAGRKKHDPEYFRQELSINNKYENAQEILFASTPHLVQENFQGYNIVRYFGKYYGVPHDHEKGFDIESLLRTETCFINESLESTMNMIVQHSAKEKKAGDDSELDRERIAEFISYGRELILQSKHTEAKRIFEELLKKPEVMSKKNETGRIYFELSRIAYKEENVDEARRLSMLCLENTPEFMEAKLMLNNLAPEEPKIKVHKVFQ